MIPYYIRKWVSVVGRNWFRTVVVLMLFGSLTVQLMILQQVRQGAVTWDDLYGPSARTKTADQRRLLRSRIPLVRINGTVDVEGNVDVGNMPEEPFQVQIVR